MTLSALAIGLLVGVFGKPDSLYPCEFWIWILACSLFVICIGTVLIGHHMSIKCFKAKIQKYYKKNENNLSKKEIDKLDNEISKVENLGIKFGYLSKCSFTLGILLTIVVVLLNT